MIGSNPVKLPCQTAALLADSQLEFCSSESSYFWTPEMPRRCAKRDFRYPENYWRYPVKHHISTWLFRRELWDRVGGFSPSLSYAEDTDWLSRARDLPMRQLLLPDVLTHLRLHYNNVTASTLCRSILGPGGLYKAHLMRMRSKRAH